MTKAKLPKELPLLGDGEVERIVTHMVEVGQQGYLTTAVFKGANRQRKADQLLYNAALEENERLEAELAKVRQALRIMEVLDG